MVLQQYFRPEITEMLIDNERGYSIDKNIAKYLSASYVDAIRFACTNFDRRLGMSMEEQLGSILQAPSRYFYNEWVVTALLNAILIDTVQHKILLVTKNSHRKLIWTYFFEHLLPERQKNQLSIVLHRKLKPDTFHDSTYIIIDDMEPFFKDLSDSVIEQIETAAPAMFLVDISIDLRSDIETLYNMIRLCRQQLEYKTPFDFINNFSGRKNWLKLVKFCNWFHLKTRVKDVKEDCRLPENQKFNRKLIASVCPEHAKDFEDDEDLSEEELPEWPEVYTRPVEREMSEQKSGDKDFFFAEGDTQFMAHLELNSDKSSGEVYGADTVIIDDPNASITNDPIVASHSVYDLDTEPLDEYVDTEILNTQIMDTELMDTELMDTEPLPMDCAPSRSKEDAAQPGPSKEKPLKPGKSSPIFEIADHDSFVDLLDAPQMIELLSQSAVENDSDDETADLIYHAQTQLIPTLKTGFESQFIPSLEKEAAGPAERTRSVEENKPAEGVKSAEGVKPIPVTVARSSSNSMDQCAQDPDEDLIEPLPTGSSTLASVSRKLSSQSLKSNPDTDTIYKAENTSEEMTLLQSPTDEPIMISSAETPKSDKNLNQTKSHKSISNLFDSDDDDLGDGLEAREFNEPQEPDPKPWLKLTPRIGSQAIVGGHQNFAKYSTPIARLCGDFQDSESPIGDGFFSTPDESARKKVRGEMIFEVTKNEVFGSVIRAKNDGDYSPFLKKLGHDVEPENQFKIDWSKLSNIIASPAKQTCVPSVRNEADDDVEMIPSSQDYDSFQTPVKSRDNSASISCSSRKSTRSSPRRKLPDGNRRKKLETLFNEGKKRKEDSVPRARSPDDLFDVE